MDQSSDWIFEISPRDHDGLVEVTIEWQESDLESQPDTGHDFVAECLEQINSEEFRNNWTLKSQKKPNPGACCDEIRNDLYQSTGQISGQDQRLSDVPIGGEPMSDSEAHLNLFSKSKSNLSTCNDNSSCSDNYKRETMTRKSRANLTKKALTPEVREQKLIESKRTEPPAKSSRLRLETPAQPKSTKFKGNFASARNPISRGHETPEIGNRPSWIGNFSGANAPEGKILSKPAFSRSSSVRKESKIKPLGAVRPMHWSSSSGLEAVETIPMAAKQRQSVSQSLRVTDSSDSYSISSSDSRRHSTSSPVLLQYVTYQSIPHLSHD